MSESELTNTNNSAGMAKIVYVLYLVGLVFGITGIIGVVISYVSKNEAPDWLKTHFDFQIRTFWIGLLFMIVGGILAIFVIGYLVFLFWLVWLIIRCVKGLQALDKQQAIVDPKSWMF